MNIQLLADEINRDFGPPFFSAGYVHAWVNRGGRLALRIGPRDVEFDAEGRIVGAGMAMPHVGETIVMPGDFDTLAAPADGATGEGGRP